MFNSKIKCQSITIISMNIQLYRHNIYAKNITINSSSIAFFFFFPNSVLVAHFKLWNENNDNRLATGTNHVVINRVIQMSPMLSTGTHRKIRLFLRYDVIVSSYRQLPWNFVIEHKKCWFSIYFSVSFRQFSIMS